MIRLGRVYEWSGLFRMTSFQLTVIAVYALLQAQNTSFVNINDMISYPIALAALVFIFYFTKGLVTFIHANVSEL